MTHTGRTRMLQEALAHNPEGMTTPQLAQAIGEASLPWQRAPNKAGIAMRQLKRLGRAIHRAVPGRRGTRRWCGGSTWMGLLSWLTGR